MQVFECLKGFGRMPRTDRLSDIKVWNNYYTVYPVNVKYEKIYDLNATIVVDIDKADYEQKVNDEWEKIVIDREILLGKISSVIYFKTNQEWLEYPKWAQNRAEIIERVKKEFPPSSTEYEDV